MKVDTHELVCGTSRRWGSWPGAVRESDEADHEAVLGLATEGRVTSVTRTVGFDQVPDALKQVASGSAMASWSSMSPTMRRATSHPPRNHLVGTALEAAWNGNGSSSSGAWWLAR